MNSSAVETTPRALDVTVTDEELIVSLVDGRRLSVPVSWFPRLSRATVEQRSKWELLGEGEDIHWSDLDEDLSVDGLLHGRPSRSR